SGAGLQGDLELVRHIPDDEVTVKGSRYLAVRCRTKGAVHRADASLGRDGRLDEVDNVRSLRAVLEAVHRFGDSEGDAQGSVSGLGEGRGIQGQCGQLAGVDLGGSIGSSIEYMDLRLRIIAAGQLH